MKLFTFICLLFSLTAFAEGQGKFQPKGKNANLSVEDLKKRSLDGLNRRLSAIQEQIKCVESAKDKPALRECRKKSKQAIQEFQRKQRTRRANKKKANQGGNS